jgi:hypothetical protein
MAAYDITTASSILEYETQFGIYPAAVLMDANHVFLIFGGVGGDATVQMFTVNTSTWAITTAAAPKENGQIGYFNNAAKLDATHVLTVCGNGASKLAGVVGVNTST